MDIIDIKSKVFISSIKILSHIYMYLYFSLVDIHPALTAHVIFIDFDQPGTSSPSVCFGWGRRERARDIETDGIGIEKTTPNST